MKKITLYLLLLLAISSTSQTICNPLPNFFDKTTMSLGSFLKKIGVQKNKYASLIHRSIAEIGDSFVICFVISHPLVESIIEMLGGSSFSDVKSLTDTFKYFFNPSFILCFIVLHTLLISLGGIGKRALGIKIINKEGKKLTFLQAFLYSLLTVNPVIAIISLFFMLFNEENQSIHDVIFKTYVVEVAK